jgi:hypothetical protein
MADDETQELTLQKLREISLKIEEGMTVINKLRALIRHGAILLHADGVPVATIAAWARVTESEISRWIYLDEQNRAQNE